VFILFCLAQVWKVYRSSIIHLNLFYVYTKNVVEKDLNIKTLKYKNLFKTPTHIFLSWVLEKATACMTDRVSIVAFWKFPFPFKAHIHIIYYLRHDAFLHIIGNIYLVHDNVFLFICISTYVSVTINIKDNFPILYTTKCLTEERSNRLLASW